MANPPTPHFSTLAVHAGAAPDPATKARATPISNKRWVCHRACVSHIAWSCATPPTSTPPVGRCTTATASKPINIWLNCRWGLPVARWHCVCGSKRIALHNSRCPPWKPRDCWPSTGRFPPPQRAVCCEVLRSPRSTMAETFTSCRSKCNCWKNVRR